MFEEYQFGRTDDVMEAMDSAGLTQQLTEDQMMLVKTAVLEALQEAGEIGQEASDKRIEETKVGVVEALNDTGLIDGKPMNPKDQVEIEKIQQEMKMKQEAHELEMEKMEQEIKLKEEDAEMTRTVKGAQAAQGMTIKERESDANMKIKAKTATMMAKQKVEQSKTNGNVTSKKGKK